MICSAMASRTAWAPCPARAGPFLTRGSMRRGPPWEEGASSIVNRVVRSTRVPIADPLRPMMRSPSQCPGTARSAASAGPLADHHLGSDELLAASFRPGSRHSQGPTGPQAGGQLSAQRSAALDEESLVDGLVGYPHGLIIGEIDHEPVGRSARGSRTLPQRRSAGGVRAGGRSKRTVGTINHGRRLGLAIMPGQALLYVLTQLHRSPPASATLGRLARRSACH